MLKSDRLKLKGKLSFSPLCVSSHIEEQIMLFKFRKRAGLTVKGNTFMDLSLLIQETIKFGEYKIKCKVI